MHKRLDEFINHIGRYRSHNTTSNYYHHIDKFLDFITTKESDFRKITQEVSLDYIDMLKEQYASTSVHTHMAAVYTFMDFCQRKGYMDSIPFFDSKEMYEYLPVVEEKQTETLTIEQLKQMIATSNGLFEETLIRVFYDTAVRVSEIVSMTWENVSPTENGALIKVTGKGKGGMSKVRWVSVTQETYRCMRKLQMTSGAMSGHVFTGVRTKKQLTTRRIDQIIKQMADRCDIDYITTHIFRKSIATHLVEKGMQIEYVSEYLGHTSINTTRRYFDGRRSLQDKLAEFQTSL
jgi:integrase/recombinase XerD